MGPELVQHPLSRADGSTVFSTGLYTVIAGVNGPVEVQRRDELPEEAAVEVNVRPSSGIGGPRERWVESILVSALKSVLLVNMHPRTLIQITLQVTKEPSNKSRRAAADVSIIPTLLNSAVIALVDGGLPLSTSLIAALATVREDGEIVLDPQEKDIEKSRSIHAMAFTQNGEQVLDESFGVFDLDSWKKVAEVTRKACISATAAEAHDTAMANGELETAAWLREALEDRARVATAWRREGP